MLEEFPERDQIDKAEELILKIRDIQSCRITTDKSGRISEIHVVAATDRQPKMIARDVETCLKAQLGLAVDYRKIGVVLLEAASEKAEGDAPGQDPGRFDAMVDDMLSESTERRTAQMERTTSAEEPARLEFLEDETRTRFRGLSLTLDETRMDVEVRLERNGIRAVGCLGAFRKSGPLHETIAEATIHALTELLDEDFHLCLSGIEEVELAGREALVAAVELLEGRSVRCFSGIAFVGRDVNEAVVLAVLDAVNRPFGRWKTRREAHYRIS